MEEFEGNLDSAFARDQLRTVLERLTYTKADQAAARAARHRIPIAGNVYDGTATLRSAVQLYRTFSGERRLPSTTRVIDDGASTDRLRSAAIPRPSVAAEAATADGGLQLLSTAQLLASFSDVVAELRARRVMRTANNPVADYGEYLVAKALELTLVANSTAGYDAVDAAGRRYEIKARRVPEGATSAQLSAIRGLDERKFDMLAAVLFAPNFAVRRACLIPYEVVRTHARYVEHVNAWNLILRPSLWNEPMIQDFTAAASAAAQS